jgi:SPP1 family predicted phage head-tail adaptor
VRQKRKPGFSIIPIRIHTTTLGGLGPHELSRRITLERPEKVPDGGGGFTSTWVVVATVWAKISTLRSDEAIIAMQTTGTAIHNIVIRFRTDVKTSWRIGYAGKYYNIIGPPIDLNKNHRFLDLKAKETT